LLLLSASLRRLLLRRVSFGKAPDDYLLAADFANGALLGRRPAAHHLCALLLE
jgi:hypothetical protein